MPPHENLRIMIVNRSAIDLYLYYRGVKGFMLELVVSKTQLDLPAHYKHHVRQQEQTGIPLGRKWKYFDGIVFDQRSLRDHFFLTEEWPDESTGEYWFIIHPAPN